MRFRRPLRDGERHSSLLRSDAYCWERSDLDRPEIFGLREDSEIDCVKCDFLYGLELFVIVH